MEKKVGRGGKEQRKLGWEWGGCRTQTDRHTAKEKCTEVGRGNGGQRVACEVPAEQL